MMSILALAVISDRVSGAPIVDPSRFRRLDRFRPEPVDPESGVFHIHMDIDDARRLESDGTWSWVSGDLEIYAEMP